VYLAATRNTNLLPLKQMKYNNKAGKAPWYKPDSFPENIFSNLDIEAFGHNRSLYLALMIFYRKRRLGFKIPV
jgi:hypothetical protein